jgi:hypothetical protein
VITPTDWACSQPLLPIDPGVEQDWIEPFLSCTCF